MKHGRAHSGKKRVRSVSVCLPHGMHEMLDMAPGENMIDLLWDVAMLKCQNADQRAANSNNTAKGAVRFVPVSQTHVREVLAAHRVARTTKVGDPLDVFVYTGNKPESEVLSFRGPFHPRR